MPENSLEKLIRLTPQSAKPKPSAKKPRFGTPYRMAWGNVSVGDAVMFGNQVWRIVAPTAHPGHKSPELPDPEVSLSATAPASTGKPAVSKPAGAKPGADSRATGQALQVYTHCLQNIGSPAKYEELTLPDDFVVMAVPLLLSQ